MNEKIIRNLKIATWLIGFACILNLFALIITIYA